MVFVWCLCGVCVVSPCHRVTRNAIFVAGRRYVGWGNLSSKVLYLWAFVSQRRISEQRSGKPYQRRLRLEGLHLKEVIRLTRALSH